VAGRGRFAFTVSARSPGRGGFSSRSKEVRNIRSQCARRYFKRRPIHCVDFPAGWPTRQEPTTKRLPSLSASNLKMVAACGQRNGPPQRAGSRASSGTWLYVGTRRMCDRLTTRCCHILNANLWAKEPAPGLENPRPIVRVTFRVVRHTGEKRLPPARKNRQTAEC
jgi:hypothetical protein